MKKQTITKSLCLVALTLCFCFPLSAKAANGYHWLLDEENARIQYINDVTNEPMTSQFADIKGYTYYFDKNGYAVTGFQKIDGFYYFFLSNGAMVKNQWHADRYFLKNGRMAVSQYVNDGSGQKKYVGKDGLLISNYKKSRKAKFIKNSKGIRYRNADGTYSAKTWQCINGRWYYFYSTGYMARKTKLGKYYVDINGRMVTNRWVKIGSYKYYYGADGRLTKKVRYKKTSSKKKVVTIK